ncbi:MAG: PAS domain S-box protein [Thermodesulfobacteriota bacterium]
MNEEGKTKEDLLQELAALRERVSELESVQTELAQLRARCRLLLPAVEQSSLGIAVVDLQGDLLFLNRAFARLHGYEPSDILGQNLSVFHTAAQMPAVLAANERIKETGFFSGEIWHVRKDGTEFPTFMDNSLLRDQAGNPIGMIGTLHDITEQKRIEKSLELQKEKLETVLEHAPFGLVLIDEDGTFRYMNPVFRSLFGYSLSEIRSGKEWFRKAFPDPEYRRKVIGTWVSDSAEFGPGMQRPRTFTVTCADGTEKVIHFRPVQLVNGQHLMTCEDVTEQRQALDALKESEQRLELALKGADLGLWDWNLLTGEAYFNERWAGMLGFEPHEIPPNTGYIRSLVHRADLSRVIGSMREHFRGRTPSYEVEFRMRSKSGAWKWILARGKVVERDEKGRAVRVTGTHLDVTQSKQLREQRDRLFSLSADLLCVARFDGYFSQLNPAWTRTLGWTEKELMGRRWLEFVHPDDRAATEASTRDLVSGHAVLTFENRCLCKNGTHRWLSWNAVAAKEDGLIYAVARDITESKHAEETLRESRRQYMSLYEEAKRAKELYRSLLDATPEAVVVYDLEGKTLYVNQSFTRIFGWTLDELKDRRIPYVPESERESSMVIIRDLIEKGTPCVGFETKRSTKEGGLLDISLSAGRYLDHKGEPAGMVVVLGDITEQKRLEEHLRHSTKMEAIGRLAGGIAHDFNNLLTAISGYAGILLQQMEEGLPHREKVSQIGIAAGRAAQLTRQLLAFSRKQLLEVKVMELNQAVHQFENILQRVIGEDVEFVTILDPCAGRVQADPGQIEQILMNLAANARDAMPGGGRLTIETANVILDEEYARVRAEVKPGPYVMLAVSDTGSGMDAQVRSRVFEPFFTTKEKGVGTGLGLATVYGIVKQHQGHIAVYSELGTGTTFKVYFPRAEQVMDTDSEACQTIRLRPGRETILVVEDEEIVRKLTEEVLEMMGYTVLGAGDPDEALDICRDTPGPIHMLVTDVVLPRMDGRALFVRIAESRPQMKVLYVSGYTENFIVHHGVLERGVHFLQKPFTVDGLVGKVQQVLEGA